MKKHKNASSAEEIVMEEQLKLNGRDMIIFEAKGK